MSKNIYIIYVPIHNFKDDLKTGGPLYIKAHPKIPCILAFKEKEIAESYLVIMKIRNYEILQIDKLGSSEYPLLEKSKNQLLVVFDKENLDLYFKDKMNFDYTNLYMKYN